MLFLLVSSDGLVAPLAMLAASSGKILSDELDGRVGGEGGAPRGVRRALLGDMLCCSH